MAGMLTEEITNEFETLFGDDASDEEIDETSTDEEEEETEEEEESEEEGSDSDSEEEEEETEEDESESEEDKKRAKQNYAFAQQRQQIKAHEAFMKQLGALIGMENARPEDVQQKVQEVLLEKQSKEQNVPIDILKRLEAAEAIVRENQEIKLQSRVQDSFTELVEKYSLEDEDVNEFTQWLIDNDKNPMEHPEVDIAAEYLKLHYDDMIQAAIDEAFNKEKERQDKVEKKAASAVPSGGSDPVETKINTVADLDKMFNSMDL